VNRRPGEVEGFDGQQPFAAALPGAVLVEFVEFPQLADMQAEARASCRDRLLPVYEPSHSGGRRSPEKFRAWLHILECVCSDEHEHRRVEGRQRRIPGWHEVDWKHWRTETPSLTVQR
jgi:hypothetical protein